MLVKYNGIQLPNLPADLSVEEYPYIFIRKTEDTGYYDLACGPQKYYYSSSRLYIDSGLQKWYRVAINTAFDDNTEWKFYKTTPSSNYWTINSSRYLIWSLFDIPSGSSTSTTVYYAGTEIEYPDIKKYLVRDNDTIYTVTEGALAEVTGELNSNLFIDNGIDTIPDGALLMTLSNPAVKVNTTAVNALALKAESDLSVVKVGNKVTITGTATGGTAPYTYKYYVDDTLVATKSGSSATEISWTPTAAKSYAIKCVVTDAAGNTVTSGKNYTVEGNSSALTGSLKVNGSTGTINLAVGGTVNLIASASGGSGSYTYKYVVHNLETNSWYTLQDYGSNSSYVTKISSIGKKEFVVSVKDGNGTIVTTNKVIVNASTTVLAGNLTVNDSTSAITANVGTSLTLKVNATGGNGKYTYKYVVHNMVTNTWYTLQDYGSNSSYVTKISSIGKKEFVVSVKDGNGTIVTTNKVIVTGINNVLSGTLKVNGSTSTQSVNVGSSLTLAASASGGSGSYTYSYLIHNTDTDAWSRVTEFIASNTYEWTASSAGNREFYVEVKDGAGTVVRSSAVKVKTTAVNAQLFRTYGVEEIPSGTLLMTLSNPEVLCWTDAETLPTLTATVKGIPQPQTIVSEEINLMDGSIKGIESVTIDCKGEPIFAVSFDKKATWIMHNGTDWVNVADELTGMTKAVFEAITTEQWQAQYEVSSDMYIRCTLLDETQSVTTVSVGFVN